MVRLMKGINLVKGAESQALGKAYSRRGPGG